MIYTRLPSLLEYKLKFRKKNLLTSCHNWHTRPLLSWSWLIYLREFHNKPMVNWLISGSNDLVKLVWETHSVNLLFAIIMKSDIDGETPILKLRRSRRSKGIRTKPRIGIWKQVGVIMVARREFGNKRESLYLWATRALQPHKPCTKYKPFAVVCYAVASKGLLACFQDTSHN